MAKSKKEKKKAGIIIGGAALLWLLLSSSKGSGGGGVSSRYYNINDVQRSDTAKEQGITEQFQPLDVNTLSNVNTFIAWVVDPLTEKLGDKMEIDSWQRHPKTNAAVGGVADSLHIPGLAIDVDSYYNGQLDNRRIALAMLKYDIPFTEMILYGSYEHPTQIHIAMDPNRSTEKEVLLKKDGQYIPISKLSLRQYYEKQGVEV